MRLSEERISHIAHLVSEGIWKDDLVDFTDDVRALKEIKDVIKGFLSLEDNADATARFKDTVAIKGRAGGKQGMGRPLQAILSKKNFLRRNFKLR